MKNIEPVDKKFEAFGWQVYRINGHGIGMIMDTIAAAKKTGGKPIIIIADTVKGKGVSFMENQNAWHGKAPNEEQLKKAIAELEAQK